MQERTQDEIKIINGMADTMLNHGDGCTDDDLCGHGFTRTQVATFKEEARDLANQRAQGIAA